MLLRRSLIRHMAAANTSGVMHCMKRTLSPIVLAASSALSPLSHGADPKVTGMFSNLRFGTEDVTGVEIYVVLSGGDYYATVQCVEGAPGIPETVKLSVSGSAVSFVVPANSSSGCLPGAAFTGHVTATDLKGNFSGTNWPGLLKRGKGYWQ